VHHSAQAAVPVSAASAVQVSLYCSQCRPGAADTVPAGAQGAVLHSAQAAVLFCPALAVQVTKDYSCLRKQYGWF
jgi:hypothetical protein